jgi:hypothetical protein
MDKLLGFKHSWIVIEKGVHPLCVVTGQAGVYGEFRVVFLWGAKGTMNLSRKY